jgi:UDP:flavonoid glycosyltransferase YjiC (YdhE family)
MSRILFAWELGGNLGHLTRDLPLIRMCQQAGHEVFMAVPNLRDAAQFLAQTPLTLVQAPILRPRHRQSRAQLNYADMLLHEGYDDGETLEGALQGWEGLFKLVKPDLMVYNHAPTALLAARVIGLPVRLLGTGFEIPPCVTPLPSFRRWETIPAQRLQEAEERCLAQINTCFTRRSMKSLDAISEIFYSQEVGLTTFAELDPFGPRQNVSYLGAEYATPSLPQVLWGMNRRYRVFAYLRPTVPGCEQLLMALQRFAAEVICAAPGLPQDWPQRFNRLRFFPNPVDLPALLPKTDLVITYGATTIPVALLAGVPVLAVPQVIEQHLSGEALEATGAGLMLRADRTEAQCWHHIKQLLGETKYRMAAMGFAKKYNSYNLTAAMRNAQEFLLGHPSA